MRWPVMYGAASGVATGAWMFGEYALGLHADPEGAGRWTGFLALAFPVVAAVLLVRRDRRASWPATLAHGLVFGAVGGVIGGAAIYAYFAWVNPSFSIGGDPPDPPMQATIGAVSALLLGVALVSVARVLDRRASD